MMIATILITLGLVGSGPSEGVEKYTVKVSESTVSWKGSKVGGSHIGNISLKEGGLELEGNEITGGNFVIDMSTITNEDLSGEYKQKLENHLKSDDFFGVESHPTATFVLTDAVANDNGQHTITGDITIKGTTKIISFPATVTISNDAVAASAEIVIDRSEFNIRFGSDSFFDNLGDKVIYDNFTLNVNLSADR